MIISLTIKNANLERYIYKTLRMSFVILLQIVIVVVIMNHFGSMLMFILHFTIHHTFWEDDVAPNITIVTMLNNQSSNTRQAGFLKDG